MLAWTWLNVAICTDALLLKAHLSELTADMTNSLPEEPTSSEVLRITALSFMLQYAFYLVTRWIIRSTGCRATNADIKTAALAATAA